MKNLSVSQVINATLNFLAFSVEFVCNNFYRMIVYSMLIVFGYGLGIHSGLFIFTAMVTISVCLKMDKKMCKKRGRCKT